MLVRIGSVSFGWAEMQGRENSCVGLDRFSPSVCSARQASAETNTTSRRTTRAKLARKPPSDLAHIRNHLANQRSQLPLEEATVQPSLTRLIMTPAPRHSIRLVSVFVVI